MGYLILIILNLFFPFAGLGVILMFLFSPRRNLLKSLKSELGQRFARAPEKQVLGDYIWFHAASVGEVRSIIKIAGDLKAFYKKPVLVTTTTSAGRAAAEKEPVFDTAVLAPLDFYPFIKNFLKIYKPARLIIVEADLWPNMITACGRSGITVGVINGRLSARSAKRYKMLSPLLKLVFSNISFVCAQSGEIKQRYISLGAPEAKVYLCGNIKYDMLTAQPARTEEAAEVIKKLGWEGAQIVVCGSTHEEEERAAIAAAAQLPDVKFIIAPRHLERKKYIEAALKESGVKYAVLSRINRYSGADKQILLADAMGLLGAFYKAAAVTFVGGTISKKGGHNLLEAAILRKPVLFGRHYYNTPDVAQKLLESGGGILTDADSFAQRIKTLITNPPGLEAAASAAEGVALSFKGATARTIAVVKEYDKKQ